MRNHRFHSPERHWGGGDRQSGLTPLLGAGAVIAVALAFASTVEPPFVAPLFGELLLFGALGFAVAAFLRGDSPWAPRVTAWDQAALLLLFSLIAGLFFDPEAVRQAMIERGMIDAPAAGTLGAAGN